MSKASQIEALIAPAIEEAGYECVDVTYEKVGKQWILTAYIDSDDGISLEDCEKVSHIVDPILDEADPIEGSYFFEVSSPGIDRPLKKERDFKKNLGNKIEVHLYAKINGKKDYTGILSEYTPEEIVLETEEGPVTFERKAISKAVPVIEI